MTSSEPSWRRWPALAALGGSLRWRFPCAHGVWGKEDGASNDLHWVAASEELDAQARRRAEEVYLGSEDTPTSLLFWRSDGAIHQAGHAYASRFVDSAGRHFLERQILEYRNPRSLPAALAALALLPRVDALDASARLDATANGAQWRPGQDPAQIPRCNVNMDDRVLTETIAAGCKDLARILSPDELGAMYAALVSGSDSILLPETSSPWTPAACAVLLLPLERPLADGLAMISRLPSGRAEAGRLFPPAGAPGVRWQLIGRGGFPARLFPPPAIGPSDAHRRLGNSMAEALLANDPTRIGVVAEIAPVPGGQVQRTEGARELRIWGAPSSGKTAYLAQLFLRPDHGGDRQWSVHLPPGSDQAWYKSRLEQLYTENRFPEPTPPGTNDRLSYRLVNERRGRSVTIAIEDRPGSEYQDFDQATAQRLARADGLLLLVDPMHDPAQQNREVRSAFLAIQQERRDLAKDPRPLALCVSKCDEYIQSVEDWYLAKEHPEGFLRELIGPTIANAVADRFEDYRLFALSAAGLHIAHGAVRPSVFYDETFEPRIATLGEPLNLLEPLIWLLERIGE